MSISSLASLFGGSASASNAVPLGNAYQQQLQQYQQQLQQAQAMTNYADAANVYTSAANTPAYATAQGGILGGFSGQVGYPTYPSPQTVTWPEAQPESDPTGLGRVLIQKMEKLMDRMGMTPDETPAAAYNPEVRVAVLMLQLVERLIEMQDAALPKIAEEKKDDFISGLMEAQEEGRDGR